MSIKIINKVFRTVTINSQKMLPAIIIWYPKHLSQFLKKKPSNYNIL